MFLLVVLLCIQDDFNETFFDSFFDLNGTYQHKTSFNKFHMLIESEEFHKIKSALVNKDKGKILMMFLKFAITFCLSQTAITSLLQLINALFAYPIRVLVRESGLLVLTGMASLVLGESCTTSIKDFTIFPPRPKKKSNAIFHGICPECALYLGTLERSSNSIHCNLCSMDIDIKKSSYGQHFRNEERSKKLYIKISFIIIYVLFVYIP